MAIEAYARRIGVRIGQRETNRAVVESCRLPGNGSVALLTGLREPSCNVVRIRSALEIFQMAGSTGRAGQVVIVADMAIEAHARRIRMCIGERESGACMVKFDVQPGVRPMATFARRGETRGHMVRVGRRLKVFRVAGVALGRETLKLPRCCAFVTRFAVNGRVRADQWEAILVTTYGLHGNVPALDGMTRFAIRAELAAVNIRMAVGTFLTHIRKN